MTAIVEWQQYWLYEFDKGDIMSQEEKKEETQDLNQETLDEQSRIEELESEVTEAKDKYLEFLSVAD